MKLTDKFRLFALNIRRKAYEEAYEAFLDIKRRNRKPKFTLKA